MKVIRSFLNTHIFTSRKKTLSLFVILIIGIAIPLTLNLLERQQDLQKYAALQGGADLTITTNKSTLAVGEEAIVTLYISSPTFALSGIEVHLGIPSNNFAVTNYNDSNSFFTSSLKIDPTFINNDYSFLLTSPLSSPRTGSGIIAILTLTALRESTSPITLQYLPATWVTAYGQLNINAINSTSSATISSITASTIPTPTPTLIPTLTPTLSPTPILVPTNTPDPNTAHLDLSIEIPGIGLKEKTGVKSPVRTARDITVMLLNSQNQEIRTTTEAISFDGNIYKGVVNVSGNVLPGSYTVKVRMDNSLWKLIPGIYNLGPLTTAKPPSQILITGDIDGNNILELSDYNIFFNCYQKSTQCNDKYRTLSDLNDSGITDQIDFNIFVRSFASRQGD